MATRAEHRRSVLRRLSDAAIPLFETHGPSVTVDEVAAEAGVSRRTVFRYVDGKEMLAFLHPLMWLDVFDDAVHDAESTSSAFDAISIGSRAIAAHVDADPAPVRRAFLVGISHEQLRSGFIPITDRWRERFTQVISIHNDGTDALQARILGAATMGMIEATTEAWMLDGQRSYRDALDEGLSLMQPLLEK